MELISFLVTILYPLLYGGVTEKIYNRIAQISKRTTAGNNISVLHIAPRKTFKSFDDPVGDIDNILLIHDDRQLKRYVGRAFDHDT